MTRVAEKMGLHASPTCQMVFDGAEAELVGEVGGGLKAMFTTMNHARIDVALQGVAQAARAGQIARVYAAGCRQGRNAAGAAVTIDAHADLRCMLDQQHILPDRRSGAAFARQRHPEAPCGDCPLGRRLRVPYCLTLTLCIPAMLRVQFNVAYATCVS